MTNVSKRIMKGTPAIHEGIGYQWDVQTLSEPQRSDFDPLNMITACLFLVEESFESLRVVVSSHWTPSRDSDVASSPFSLLEVDGRGSRATPFNTDLTYTTVGHL